MEVRKVWDIPEESQFAYTGEDWLLVLLLLWRAWHLRNDVIHNKGEAHVKDSVIFLQNYAASLSMCNLKLGDYKGKQPMFEPGISTLTPAKDVYSRNEPSETLCWLAPLSGWTKTNVDGLFSPATGEASIGVAG